MTASRSSVPGKLCVWVVSLLVTCAALHAAESPAALSEFQAKLKAVGTHERFDAALLGIKVESLETGKLIYEQNADKLLKPASNAKMYTGALALDRLGPDFRIRTSFYAKSKPDRSGTIKGDLIVFGRGDPSFSHRFNDGDYQKAIDQLVNGLADAGIKRIKGDLIGDDSYFRGSRFGIGWSVDDLQYYYGAEASALTLQENTVDLVFKPGKTIGAPLEIETKPISSYLTFVNKTKTVEKGGRRNVELLRPIDSNTIYVWGSLPVEDAPYEDAVAVYDAPRWFVTTLKEALHARGIKVSGKVRTATWLDRESAPLDLSALTEVAFVESRPMAEIVKNMMKPSQNLYAHLLLLQVGEKVRTAENAKMNSDDLGLMEMRKFLEEAGMKSGDVLLEEGSGLSRGCLLKPAASVQLLKYMDKHRYAQAFRDSLPIAGVDGTLRSRFKGTPAEKNLHAKTGTIRYVSSISGYVTNVAGEKLVFSIMLNNYNGRDGRSQTDGLAEMLSRMSVRTDKEATVTTGGVPIFNGKTFNGWDGDTKTTFRIEDGAIVGGNLKERIPRNEFLCTTRPYTNFVLNLKFKLVGQGANAGVQIRTKRIPNHHEVSGYQADMGDPAWWGCLYDESRRNKILAKSNIEEVNKVLKRGDWNDYKIRCDGNRIQLWINGQQTIDYTETEKDIENYGVVAVQIHGGPPSEAWYKDIRIEELP